MADDQQKKQIQNAAAELFTLKGYNGTTIHEIAARAGVNPATIYRHFPGKRQLFDALGSPELDFPDRQEEHTRLTIRQAALRVFSQKGFAAATMDEIAAAAGLSKAGVYFYYPSKDELFKAALEKSPGFSALEEAVKREGQVTGLTETLANLAYTYLSLFKKEEFASLIRVVLSEGVHGGQVAGYFQEKAIRAGSEAVAGFLSQFINLDPVGLSARIQMFFGMLFSWGLVNILMSPGNTPDDEELRVIAGNMTDQFIRGLQPYVRVK
jgi:AcrR family transcriptional regulator